MQHMKYNCKLDCPRLMKNITLGIIIITVN